MGRTDGNNKEKKYTNLIELYTNGDIDRKEFIDFRKNIMHK